MTLAPLLREAADSMRKASTPEPFSTSKTSNWVARAGGLPDYVQHIAHDLMEKGGKSESEAIRLAVGIVKHPPKNWGPEARAAAAKAAAEWEAKKASSHAKVQASLEPWFADELVLREAALERVVVYSAVFGGPSGLIRVLADGALAESVGDANGQAVAEVLRLDLAILEAVDIPPLARVQEARRRDPFDLVSEAFHPDELRGFHGKWIAGGGHHGLTPRTVVPARYSPRQATHAAQRYEGGVPRASARARRAHAALPQIARATDKKPEVALAAAVRSGKWDKSSAEASRRLLAQPQMGMAEIEHKVASGDAIDTEKAHRTGPGGAYSAERKALHEHIISLLLQGKGVHEGKARAIFTAGGGASGKSAMISSGVVDVPHDAVIANPDVVREMLPEYKALKAAGREDAASLTHEEASHITKVVTRLALGRQHHVLVDGVGDSKPGKFAGKIRAAMKAGHTASVHYATIPTAEAIKRSDIRGKKSGRYVDHGVLRQAHKSVSANFQEIHDIPGLGLQVFDTTNRTPELMADRPATSDKLVIGKRAGFQSFLDKAKE